MPLKRTRVKTCLTGKEKTMPKPKIGTKRPMEKEKFKKRGKAMLPCAGGTKTQLTIGEMMDREVPKK